MIRRAMVFGTILAAVSVIAAQDATPKKVSVGLRAYIVADNRYPAGDERNRSKRLHDQIAEFGAAPVAAILSRSAPTDESHPTIAALKVMEGWGETYKLRHPGLFATYFLLDKPYIEKDDRLKVVEPLDRLFVPLVKNVMVGLATKSIDMDGQEVPNPALAELGAAADDEIVLVVYHRLGVKKVWKTTADAPFSAEVLAEAEAELRKAMGVTK